MKKFCRTQLPLMILSLALAFIFWLVVSGQDMSTHDLSATLELQNIPSYLALDDSIPDTVNIRVEANTAQLKFLDGRRLFVRADLNSIEAGLNILPIDLNLLDPPLPRGVRIIRVIPEEISFEAHPFITKKVHVQPPLHGTLPDYLDMEGTIIIEPSEATLTGPENKLAELNALVTTPINLGDIKNSLTYLTIYPQLPGLDNWLTVQPMEFKAHAEVSLKTDEAILSVPITFNNSDEEDNIIPITKPREAKVTISWTLDRPTPKPDDIKIFFELENQQNRRRSMRLQLQGKAGNGITIKKIEPIYVSVSWPEYTSLPTTEEEPQDNNE